MSDDRTPYVEVQVCSEDFSVAGEAAAMRDRQGGRAGAYATFVGLVRAAEAGDTVLHLEHYPGMTERSIERIAQLACERWSLLDLVVIHRVGGLPAGEQIVFVGVASGHRPDAFAACEFVMDYLKTDAVFWKREQGQSGSHWIESTDSDRERQRRW